MCRSMRIIRSNLYHTRSFLGDHLSKNLTDSAVDFRLDQLAATQNWSDNRVLIAKSGAVPALIPLMSSLYTTNAKYRRLSSLTLSSQKNPSEANEENFRHGFSENNAGVEAPRNSLEMEEAFASFPSSTMKGEESFNIPVRFRKLLLD
ncbi:hypothetical protein RHSIM_Rhsim03G0174900 [Rhododendron simsii]|uniref:Uncharacterized protein n=1 Tax=Rhododendron simsii TaxID=118357 RepID=A0A834H5C6_RHOSS|nr:hypothetical protein RHSIM_Rhsim03G0174900 [Rhododendron simsii]